AVDRLSQQTVDRYSPLSNRNLSSVNDVTMNKLLSDFVNANGIPAAKEVVKQIQIEHVDKDWAVYMPQGTQVKAWTPELKNYEGEQAFSYSEGYRDSMV